MAQETIICISRLVSCVGTKQDTQAEVMKCLSFTHYNGLLNSSELVSDVCSTCLEFGPVSCVGTKQQTQTKAVKCFSFILEWGSLNASVLHNRSIIFVPPALNLVPTDSPSGGGDVTVYAWLKPTELAHSFLFYFCFCLHGPFNCISYHKFSQQLSVFLLSSSGLISALLVLSAISLFVKVSFSLDKIPSGLLGWKRQLTN